MKGLFKKLLQGFIFGLGFGVAFILVVFFFSPYIFENSVTSSLEWSNTEDNEINQPPPIKEEYLGSTGVSASNTADVGNKVLTSGGGRITGVVVGDGARVAGVTLRLGLNKTVNSQWVTTNDAGEYSIAVPYGEYQIHGFQLDHDDANRALAGLIISPANQHTSDRFVVAEGEPGRGLYLQFVKPVIKRLKRDSFTLDEPIVIGWEPYPSARSYRVQVYQKANMNDYLGNDTLFEWSDMPEITGTSLDLQKFSNGLTAGKFYTYHVTALDERGAAISESKRKHHGHDFQIQ